MMMMMMMIDLHGRFSSILHLPSALSVSETVKSFPRSRRRTMKSISWLWTQLCERAIIPSGWLHQSITIYRILIWLILGNRRKTVLAPRQWRTHILWQTITAVLQPASICCQLQAIVHRYSTGTARSIDLNWVSDRATESHRSYQRLHRSSASFVGCRARARAAEINWMTDRLILGWFLVWSELLHWYHL